MACDVKPMLPWGLDAFCPAWPGPARESPLAAAEQAAIRGAAHQALRPFDAGVTQRSMWEALKTRCAQRLCLHVQLINNRVYVVAPHAKPCTSYHDPASACSPSQRRKTPGLSKPNFWKHVATGLEPGLVGCVVRPSHACGLRPDSQPTVVPHAARVALLRGDQRVRLHGEGAARGEPFTLTRQPCTCVLLIPRPGAPR